MLASAIQASRMVVDAITSTESVRLSALYLEASR
jgi:hypothetical protein